MKSLYLSAKLLDTLADTLPVGKSQQVMFTEQVVADELIDSSDRTGITSACAGLGRLNDVHKQLFMVDCDALEQSIVDTFGVNLHTVVCGCLCAGPGWVGQTRARLVCFCMFLLGGLR